MYVSWDCILSTNEFDTFLLEFFSFNKWTTIVSQMYGEFIFSGSLDSSLHVHEACSGKLVLKLPSYHNGAINSIAVSE